MKNLKMITLELTLKPFRNTQDKFIEEVCRDLFNKWFALVRHSDTVGVMLWVAEGSEILEYNKDLDMPLEWAKYVGGANQRMGWNKKTDPDGLGLHTRHYDYMENPPEITYFTLKKIIETLKRVGSEMLGKPIYLIATFDPGPEFAKSNFKYVKHNEICAGESMGRSSMVCCYHTLNADTSSYAGFPDGIPQGLPFGTFLGRQSQEFLTDMGYDAIWLSNGFGFGTETWGMTGALYDGKNYYPEKLEDVKARIMEFWELFRRECSYPIQTRGTNNTVGIDFASDGVNHKGIYEKVNNLLPPPNSPWAALNGDFGLELAGYMSRMAELPEEDYIFRFYTADPWWASVVWSDRYGGQPHDIYLPLSITRLDANGTTKRPEYLGLLSVDTTFGDIPEHIANECTPHFLKAFESFPDKCSPFLWVYPFKEYNELNNGRLSKPYFEDRFIVNSINAGFPLNTVISTDNFKKLIDKNFSFEGINIVTPVPNSDDEINGLLIDYAKRGGNVIIYGSLVGADENLLEALHLKAAEAILGEAEAISYLTPDDVASNQSVNKVVYSTVNTDGGAAAILADDIPEVLCKIKQNESERITGVAVPQSSGGELVWIRGNLRENNEQINSAEYMRYVIRRFGYCFECSKQDLYDKPSLVLISRNENAFWFSCYNNNQTVDTRFKMPLGAPVFIGSEVSFKDGYTNYHLPRALHAECRAFINQSTNGVVYCHEEATVSYFDYRCFEIGGLINADVYIFPREEYKDKMRLLLNSPYPFFVGDDFEFENIETPYGPAILVKNVTGNLRVYETHIEEIPPRDDDDRAEDLK